MRLGRTHGWITICLASCLTSACHKKTTQPPAALPAPQARPQPSQPATTSTGPSAPRRPRNNTPSATASPTPTQAAPTQPEFKLGQALTPEEQRYNNALIDQHLQSANRALAAIGSSALTIQQKSTIDQVKGFISQAQRLRSTNLIGARSLAERADVLANDVLQNLK